MMKMKRILLFLVLVVLPGSSRFATATEGPTPNLAAGAPGPINCSVDDCGPLDQPTINGFLMFDETNFDPVVDGFGRPRQFWVHIPTYYDYADGESEKIPVIFAFHGYSQEREAMVDGKWGDFFDNDVAFVIPRGEPDPCDATGETTWIGPKYLDTVTPADPNCDPATQQAGPNGDISYWNASISGTFADVEFVETLRSMLLERFPRLNANKVYASGFSAGGGIALTLLCYRSDLFRGFSTAGITFTGDIQRGDYDEDGIEETDGNSLVATCGKTILGGGHATGISYPDLWGVGRKLVYYPLSRRVAVEYRRSTVPVVAFYGNQDEFTPSQEIDGSNIQILEKNNLDTAHILDQPYNNSRIDLASTRLRAYSTPADPGQSSSPFHEYLVLGISPISGGHAMPDAEECFNLVFATCDYSYTEETFGFFINHADLDLDP